MIGETILAHLLHDDSYSRKVLPFLKPEYFDDAAARHYRVLFEVISDYSAKYGSVPTQEAISVELDARTNITEETARAARDAAYNLRPDANTAPKWLLDRTEDFCKRKAAYQTATHAFELIAEGEDEMPLTAIHDMWKDALSISFDPDLGHDYLDDAEKRFDSYKKQERRIPFDIPVLNKITRGGLPTKSLSVIMAPTGAGKSQFMGHLAAHQLMMGKNVLYFTLEMSAMEQIGERVDANLMGVNTSQIEHLSREVFMAKIEGMRRKTLGKFIIKEYPTGSAGVQHFRAYINELQLKRSFTPDIIYVDYINLCMSSRYRKDAGLYEIVKAIAEELRGLAMEFNVPVVTATQTNRQGFNNSEPDMTNTAESIGLPQTADFMISLTANEELESKGQLMVKQLKNRWCGTTEYNKFMLGIDRARMRLYELDEKASMFNSPVKKPERLNLEDFK